MTPIRTALLCSTVAALPLLTGCDYLGIDHQSLAQIYSAQSTTGGGSPSEAIPRQPEPKGEKPNPMAEQKPLHPPFHEPPQHHEGDAHGHDPQSHDPHAGTGVGEPCGAPDHANGHGREHCVALRYFVYRDLGGDEVETREQAARELDQVNRIWDECGIHFQIETYQGVTPRDFELQYRTADYDELSEIRRAFGADSAFLVVKTGPWNRRGSLGNTGANAWTSLPGDGLYGAILEKPVASDPNMLAHELGHYMSLDHVRDREDLMSPVVYDRSLRLDRDQCEAARWALRFYWSKALR